MQSFTDRSGKAWPITLTIGSLKRVKAETGIDLLDLAHHERCAQLVDRIQSDPFLLCDVIFSAVQPDITKEQFAESFDGDVVEAATEALLKSITDFSQSQRRPLLAKVLDKLKALDTKRVQAAMTLLDDPRMDQMMDTALNSGRSSTGSPESSASTPAHSLSAS